jgi:hypothetical protein
MYLYETLHNKSTGPPCQPECRGRTREHHRYVLDGDGDVVVPREPRVAEAFDGRRRPSLEIFGLLRDLVDYMYSVRATSSDVAVSHAVHHSSVVTAAADVRVCYQEGTLHSEGFVSVHEGPGMPRRRLWSR